jgi:hypothetical protein
MQSITTTQATQIQTCIASPTQDCIVQGLTLLSQTGCATCLTDLTELAGRNEMCSVIKGQLECEATNTPCAGEPPVDELAPGEAPGEAPFPAGTFFDLHHDVHRGFSVALSLNLVGTASASEPS